MSVIVSLVWWRLISALFLPAVAFSFIAAEMLREVQDSGGSDEVKANRFHTRNKNKKNLQPLNTFGVKARAYQ